MSNLLSALPTTYRSQPVIPYAPNGPDARGHQWDEPATTLETPSGLTVVSTTQITAAQGGETFPLQYVGLTRADARAIEQFAEDRAGRFEGFWCPTFQHDFYASPGGSGNTIYVREFGYSTLLYPNGAGYRHLAGHFGGSWGVGRWNGGFASVGTDAQGYTLTSQDVDAGSIAGTAVWSSATSATGLALMRVLWVRFADDACTTEWTHPNLASITLRVVDNSADAP